MTDKTKMSNLESYRELSLQITTLSMKLDKVLELLNKPEITVKLDPLQIKFNDHPHVGADVNLNEVIHTLNEHTRRAILNNETFDEAFK